MKYNKNGYDIDKPKLIKVSLNKIICVLIYTAQKQVIKYQKKNDKIKNKRKKIINLNNNIFFMFLAKSIISLISCFSLISNILFSERAKSYIIILIIAGTIEE